MPLTDTYELRWQPLVKRLLTGGTRRQVYVADAVRFGAFLAWPVQRLRTALPNFHGARVNLGAGATHLPGWIHVDANPLRRPDVWMDVRTRWPFRSASLSGIATSHLLEHLFDVELDFALREALRVLQPGGFFRISVPDLDKAVSQYLRSSTLTTADSEARGEQFHRVCHWFGAHHQVFNFGRLRSLLLRAGFSNVQRWDSLQSHFLSPEEIRAIDLHPDESLFVECVHPSPSTRSIARAASMPCTDLE